MEGEGRKGVGDFQGKCAKNVNDIEELHLKNDNYCIVTLRLTM